MNKLEALESKIKSAVKLIAALREKNFKLENNYQKLAEENNFLHSENKQVSRLRVELEKTKHTQSRIKQKCEKILEDYERMKV